MNIKCANLAKRFIIIGLFALILSVCNDINQRGNLLDYEKLQELNAEMVKEFGNNGIFFFGHLRDLVILSDSIIIVSDFGKKTIEQFNTDGEHIATIAQQGSGPGELPSFFLLYNKGDETLVVRNSGISNRIDYFSPEDNGIYKYTNSNVRQEINKRFITIIGYCCGAKYYAYTSLNYQNVQRYVSKANSYSYRPVVLVDGSDNILEDSLHTLKIPHPIVKASGNSITILGMPPYQYRDRFRITKNGKYLIARPGSSSLLFYNNNHELIKQISLNVKKRPVEKNDLNYGFKILNLESESREDMKARIPDMKPPFLNIWMSKKYIWLHTDNGEKGKQIVILKRNGEALGTLWLPILDEIKYFKNERIYTIHKNPTSGHSIRIYKVTLR